jgi:hypothetical protein
LTGREPITAAGLSELGNLDDLGSESESVDSEVGSSNEQRVALLQVQRSKRKAEKQPDGVYMGGAHHEVGSLSRKRYTQYVGQQPKGHWGNSENTGGDPHGRRQGRECACTVCTNGAAGRQTQLEELKNTNTNTRGARQLESRLDLHARGTKGGHRQAFSGIWLRGLSPAGKVLTGCARRAATPRTPSSSLLLVS